MYIGQTTKSIEERFNRHIQDSNRDGFETNLARAIRKYGKESFIIEQIDEAENQKELDEKEIYWINKYNSVKEGYNMTNGAIGGNTYQFKTNKEMVEIREKISNSKIGEKNPNHSEVKCKNIITEQELHFKTVDECQRYFNQTNHAFICSRCNKRINKLYKKEWLIAYENDEYIDDYTFGTKTYLNKKVKIKNLINLEEKEFESYASAERYYKFPRGTISNKSRKLKSKCFEFENFI